MTAAAVSSVSDATSDLLTSVRRYRKQSNIGVALGMCGHIAALFLSRQPAANLHILSAILFIFASVTWFYGLAYYAKAKGRAFGWAILGCLGLPGLVILTFLRDHNRAVYAQTKKMPWTKKVILGLILFMIVFGGFVSYMGARAKQTTPQPEREMTQHRSQYSA